jgi:hypothetical protein
MYLIDVGAATRSCPYICSVLFLLVRYGAPEGTRTPNLLIRSAKFTHSGGYYLGLCLLWLHRRATCSALVDWS